MLDALAGFVEELRRAGLPVSLTENLDALEALHHIPLEDREGVKSALGATLVKDQGHWAVFETVFDVYFSLWRPVLQAPGPAGEAEVGEDTGRAELIDDLDPEEIQRLLEEALQNGDRGLQRLLARAVVTRFAGIEPGRPVGGTYYLYRTLRRLDLEGALTRLLAQPAEPSPSPMDPLAQRLRADRLRAHANEFRREVEAEIRRRLVADRGREVLARNLRRPLPEDVDFMHATRDELAAMQRALQPLTTKLAARLARRRRHGRKGPLDFRSTVRHSLSSGGVPLELRWRHPRPAKPEIMVVADISGSVASFARFTLCLVHAISSQFSRVRSFVFIDGIDEVTRHFEESEDVADAVRRVNTEADVVWVDGHSDYGHALETFAGRWGDHVGPRTTVILLGDARNNYHAANAWVLEDIQAAARHLFWLNPEPRPYWDTGDSIVSQYSKYCDGVFECRNLRQLSAFVENLA